MSIDITWDNQSKTMIRYTFTPDWTLTEFHESFHAVRAMFKETTNRVIGIIVEDNPRVVPPKGALDAFRRTVKEGTIPLVIVGQGQLAKMLMKVVETTYNPSRPIHYTKTLDEARNILYDLSEDETRHR